MSLPTNDQVDQLMELQGHLERELARKTVADVEKLAQEGMRGYHPFYKAGYEMACEEILYRLQLAWGEVTSPNGDRNDA